MLLTSQAFAGTWVPAQVVVRSGDTVYGEVKAGKRSFSNFLKFRNENGDKKILIPEEVSEVITTDIYFRAIWFDEVVSGYNIWRFGKVKTIGCIDIYDVYYPYRSCACKTAGTYQNHWVISIPDNPLFIIYHDFFNDVIKNPIELQYYLKDYTNICKELNKKVKTREDLLREVEIYNEMCLNIDRTYKIDESINNGF